MAAVQRAARELSSTPRPQGVRQIVPTYTWDDIVLSDARKELLQTIPLHVLQAGRVLEEWGFASRIPYGQGVAALFSGPSGTGKTMAAQIIAGALGVDLLQVDLSKTISKYIGETEKNLDRIFDAAEGAGSVLLFDEADAIFGKRTEIKDAHDRHANVEVAYLLQRMEAFRGLAVLTTNFKQNIDDAFVRRLRFVIEFALPTAPERERIWRKAFPALAPLAADVDVALLAGRLQIPGGSIQNIALHAAFLAAAAGGPITAAARSGRDASGAGQDRHAGCRTQPRRAGACREQRRERRRDRAGDRRAPGPARRSNQRTRCTWVRRSSRTSAPAPVALPVPHRPQPGAAQRAPLCGTPGRRYRPARGGARAAAGLALPHVRLPARPAPGAAGMADPDELLTLGRAVQALHERPFIDGARPARPDHPRAVPDGRAEPGLGPVPADVVPDVDGLPGEPGASSRSTAPPAGPPRPGAHVPPGSLEGAPS